MIPPEKTDTQVLQAGSEVLVRETGGVLSDADPTVFVQVDEKSMKALRTGDTYLFKSPRNMGVFTVRQTYDGGAKPKSLVVSHGGRMDGPYAGTVDTHRKMVYVLEPAEPVDTEEQVNCRVCDRTFDFDRNGIDYRQKAEQHVREQHNEDGQLDDEAVQKLLDES